VSHMAEFLKDCYTFSANSEAVKMT
jgi:hypothetical protein